MIPVVHGSVVRPVKAIRDYVAAAGSIGKGGKLMGGSLSAQSIANVVKDAMASLGLDPRSTLATVGVRGS